MIKSRKYRQLSRASIEKSFWSETGEPCQREVRKNSFITSPSGILAVTRAVQQLKEEREFIRESEQNEISPLEQSLACNIQQYPSLVDVYLYETLFVKFYYLWKSISARPRERFAARAAVSLSLAALKAAEILHNALSVSLVQDFNSVDADAPFSKHSCVCKEISKHFGSLAKSASGRGRAAISKRRIFSSIGYEHIEADGSDRAMSFIQQLRRHFLNLSETAATLANNFYPERVFRISSDLDENFVLIAEEEMFKNIELMKLCISQTQNLVKLLKRRKSFRGEKGTFVNVAHRDTEGFLYPAVLPNVHFVEEKVVEKCEIQFLEYRKISMGIPPSGNLKDILDNIEETIRNNPEL